MHDDDCCTSLRALQKEERQDPTYEPDVEQSHPFPDSSEDENDATSLSGAKKRKRVACSDVADEEALRFGREAALKALARMQQREALLRCEEEDKATRGEALSKPGPSRPAQPFEDDDCVVIEPARKKQSQTAPIHPLFARGYKPNPASATAKAAVPSKAPRGPGSRGGRGAYSTGNSSKKPAERKVRAHRQDAGVVGYYSGVERFLGKMNALIGVVGVRELTFRLHLTQGKVPKWTGDTPPSVLLQPRSDVMA